MELIKQTFRRVIEIQGYRGTCWTCYGAIEWLEPLVVIEIADTELYFEVIPIDAMMCPYCHEPVRGMQIWKSIDITEELKQLEKKK